MKNKSIVLILALLALLVLLGAQTVIERPLYTPIMVSVSGMVSLPGQYQLTTNNRLSDAIGASSRAMLQSSLSLSIPRESLPTKPWESVADSIAVPSVSFRSIHLTRGGQSQEYDLLRYFRTGDISQNPLLRDGDLIFVPGIGQVVTISGELHRPGEYEFKAGDTLDTIIQLAGGLNPAAELSQAKLFRYDDLSGRYVLQDGSISPGQSLNARDRIIIPGDSRISSVRRVKVQGQVQNPGEYLLSEGMGLRDLLALAGGPTTNADLKSAIYLNTAMNEAHDAEFDRLKSLTLGSMTSLEYSYLRTKLRQIKGRYAVDIAAIWSGSQSGPELHNNDLIYIPETMNMVWVGGQVHRPGLVPYVEGADYRDYIAAAGGISQGARLGGTRIIEVDSGNWVKPKRNRPLMPGDTVFVPDRVERDFWTDVKDVLLIATQLITIFVGVNALGK
jgi:protein involved in polysaccharide export with SLBB domain